MLCTGPVADLDGVWFLESAALLAPTNKEACNANDKPCPSCCTWQGKQSKGEEH
jgi:hypothetical protein